MGNSFAFIIPLTQETKSKSRHKSRHNLGEIQIIDSIVVDFEFATNSEKTRQAQCYVFARLLKDDNLLLRQQPEAILAPVSYRSSCCRRQRKRLLLKVPSICFENFSLGLRSKFLRNQKSGASAALATDKQTMILRPASFFYSGNRSKMAALNSSGYKHGFCTIFCQIFDILATILA